MNTFRGKYGALPGDIKDPDASGFSFITRGSQPGEGDGNGIIQGNGAVGACGFCVAAGEPMLYWEDLSAAHLIEGGFNTATATSGTYVTGTTIGNYIPAAKIGGGNYIYVWSGGSTVNCCSPDETGSNAQNYFALVAVQQFAGWQVFANAGLTVQQAYNIDQKIDDGLPQSDNTIANYVDENSAEFSPVWASSGGQYGLPYTTATVGSSGTCFDNNNTPAGTPGVSGAVQHYSLEISNGSNLTCGLSFRFQ